MRIWADGILPELDAVIVMDTNDEVVLGDIADLWSVFAEFEPAQVIGSMLEMTQHYHRFTDPKCVVRQQPAAAAAVAAAAAAAAAVAGMWRDSSWPLWARPRPRPDFEELAG